MALVPNDYYILVNCPEVVTISDNQCNYSMSEGGATGGTLPPQLQHVIYSSKPDTYIVAPPSGMCCTQLVQRLSLLHFLRQDGGTCSLIFRSLVYLA